MILTLERRPVVLKISYKWYKQMKETLQQIWYDMSNTGYLVRKNHKDGLQAWQPYKEKYSKYLFSNNQKKIVLKQSFIDLTDKIKYTFNDKIEHSDASIVTNNETLDNNKETDHFIIQHFRIPKMLDFQLPVVKFAQIAYNIGQARAVFMYENSYNDNIKNFYNQNNLDQISTYIDENLIYEDTIQSAGSSYKTKYRKYKKKYIMLSANI